MAIGITFSGSSVSPAVKPTSSMPVKANTTIWNDQNADMQITYVADTKSYIDKKFKELSDAIVASVNKE